MSGLIQCVHDGQAGWQWGVNGACHVGNEAKLRAISDGRLIERHLLEKARAIIFETATAELQKAVSNETYATIAKELGDYLAKEFNAVTQEAVALVLKNLDNAFELGTITDAFIERQLKAVSTASGPTFASIVENKVKLAITKIYLLPFEEMGFDTAFAVIDTEAIAWTVDNTMYWIGSYYDRVLSKTLANKTKEIIAEGLTRQESITLLRSELGSTIARTDAYWSGLSNHITTTSRMFGTISTFEKAGIEVYKIHAVIDRRTSDECRFMDGKKFKTADAVSLRDKMMSAATPEEAIKIKPWYNAEQLAEFETLPVSTSFPPYHFGCRTTIEMVGTI